ncbi:MAG: hypothetical protein A2X36_09255 [Elusimicrobia bacterium GWA2_69_24]|nr:MAG: hypothetical protein A2X36_09255 [Elusimicrobia bacterium GWA2_69_24]
MQPQKYWREIPARYRLEGGRCKKCRKAFLPSRLVCDACGSREFEKARFTGTGTVHSFTMIHTPPSGYSGPYVLAIVELDGGPKLTMQIADCGADEAKIGDKVRVEFRKLTQVGDAGVLCYGYKAVLV